MKLICYLAHGYPSIEKSVQTAGYYVEAGCDVLEISIPFSNPFLDSEYIGERMIKALEACADYDQYLEGILEIKKQNPQAKIILLSYEEALLNIGLEKFADFCLEHDFKTLILVGEKDETSKEKLMERGLEISSYVPFHLPEKEVEAALGSNGFVYLQATPGEKVNPNYPTLKDCIRFLREEKGLTREIYCGVGIHGPKDIQRAKEAGVDGVFVGSTILKLMDRPEKLKEQISKLKEYC